MALVLDQRCENQDLSSAAAAAATRSHKLATLRQLRAGPMRPTHCARTLRLEDSPQCWSHDEAADASDASCAAADDDDDDGGHRGGAAD